MTEKKKKETEGKNGYEKKRKEMIKRKEKKNSNFCGCVELFPESISVSNSFSNTSHNKFQTH